MFKLLSRFALLLGIASAAHAQMLTITGHVLDASGNPLASGTVLFTPVSCKTGVPISFQMSGGQAMQRAVPATVTAGVFTLPLPDVSQTFPTNVGFRETSQDPVPGLIGTGYNCIQPVANSYWCGATSCNLDNYHPNTTPQPLIQTGPTGQPGPPLLLRGVWASGTTYSAGDVVSYSSGLYVSLAGSNINNTPGSSGSYWRAFSLAAAVSSSPGDVQVADAYGNAAPSDSTTKLNSLPIQEYANTAHPPLAYWDAAFHNCTNQVVYVNVHGTSRSIVDLTVTDPSQTTGLSVTFAGRWVNRLAQQLKSMCPSHGTGIVPLRWGTGNFATQGLNADYFAGTGGATAVATDTSLGPRQGTDPMVVTYTVSGGGFTFNTHGQAFDHLRMFAVTGVGLHAWTMSIDGTSVGSCGGSGTGANVAVLCTSSSVTLGQHTASFTCATQPCEAYAVEATAGSVGIAVNNFSIGGASAEAFAQYPTTQYAFENLITDTVGLDILEQTCNEPGNSISTTQFQTTLNNILAHDAALSPTPASVLFIGELQDNLSGQAPFYPIYIATAKANNAALVDMRDRWGTGLAPAFLFGPDGTHESNPGNGEVYSGVANTIIDIPPVAVSAVDCSAYGSYYFLQKVNADGTAVCALPPGSPSGTTGVHTATIVGAPTFGAGLFSSALTASSDSNYLAIPSGTYPLVPPYTLEARIKTTSSVFGIAVAGGSTSSGGIVYLGANGGKLQAGLSGFSGVGTTTYTVNDGAWHHVAIVVSSTTAAALFADGTQVGTYAGTLTALTSTSGLIGRWIDGSLPWNGSVDEVALWSTAKYTGTYTVPASAYTGSEAGLVALYHLDGAGLDSSLH